MAYNENQQRVCVEFCKSAGTIGQGRTIRLNHGPQQVPPQLYGRIDGVRLGFTAVAFRSYISLQLASLLSYFLKTLQVSSKCGCVQAFWSSFMQDVDALARVHPYVVPPSARQGGEWVLCGLLGDPRLFLPSNSTIFACLHPEVQQIVRQDCH